MPKLSPLSEYGWNERAGRYVDQSTGRFVSFRTVKTELEAVVTASASNINTLSTRLVSGDITLAEWQLGMEREIKLSHVASAAAAKGGWAQMTPSDWGWVGSRVKEQYAYLRNFAQQIASGKEKLNGHLVARAEQYGMAARATYEEMRRRVMTNRGATEERRRITPGAEHCEGSERRGTPGCEELALLGWQPIGSLPPIGAATCLMHCKCYFEYKDANGTTLGD
jgi:hypothetical protein